MRFSYMLLGLALVGCQATPEVFDVPGPQSYDRDRAEVWPGVVGAIEAKGLSIVEANAASGRLSATLVDYQPKGWAACKRVRVVDRQDDKSRRGRGRPDGRQLKLNVQVDEGGSGSIVRLAAAFSERQINPFRNLPLRNRIPCQSTGQLERDLFGAIGRG